MQKWKVVIVLFIYSFGLGGYLYYKGYQGGWDGYKHSKNMQLTLKSQYRFGFLDGLDMCKDDYCWEIYHQSCYGKGYSDGWNDYYEAAHGLTK